MHGKHAIRRLGAALAGVAVLVTASIAAAAPAATCGICGKNLIKNPGAEAGAGITAVGAYGVVPGWTNTAGQFGAASYTFPNGWFCEDLEGLAGAREELLLRRHDDRGHVRQGNCRYADDQAPGEGGGAQGDARRLDRELRHGADREHDAGSRGLRRRERHGAGTAPDRQRHDGRGHRHGVPQPQGQRSRGRHPGDDRRDVRRGEQLQARRRGRPLARARLTDSRAASCRACRPTRRGVRSQRSTATAGSTASSSACASSARPNRSSPSSA